MTVAILGRSFQLRLVQPRLRHNHRAGRFPWEGVPFSMRRYELMLVIRPDVPEDRVQAVLDRSTRTLTGAAGQIIKVSPWGRRRLAYPIGAYREGSYHIVLFEAPPEVVVELEHG